MNGSKCCQRFCSVFVQALREDIGATAAELVYGTTIRIPGEFFLDEEMPPDPKFFVEKFRHHMTQVRATPISRHDRRKVFVHKDLSTCSHVFVRIDRVKKPLEHPYEGPYKVLERLSDNVFKMEIQGKATNISVERLKPAYFEVTSDPTEAAQRPISLAPKTFVGPRAKPASERRVIFDT